MNIVLLAVLVLAFALSPSLLAQSSGPGGMPPGHQMLADPARFADGHVAALDQQVHLSADQKAQLRPVFLDEGNKLFAIFNNTAMSQQQKQAAIEKLHLETAAKVGSLLTPAQRQQWAPVSTPPRSSGTSQT